MADKPDYRKLYEEQAKEIESLAAWQFGERRELCAELERLKAENATLRVATGLNRALRVAQDMLVNRESPPPSDQRWAQIADALARAALGEGK